MTEIILRGSKIRIYPNQRQAQIIDLWRRRTTSLWNLLLSFEQAAYSGEHARTEPKWRGMLVEIANENYERDLHIWNHGRGGKRVRKPGHERLADYDREKVAYDEAVLERKENIASWKRAGKPDDWMKPKKPVEPKEPKAPEPPSAEFLAKVLNGRDGTLYFPDDDLGEDGEPQDKAYQPRLFIWARELMALMARLKQVERTRWIGDLPSHAAQVVAKDLVKAIEAMLRERKKRASGNGGRDTGFPKQKGNHYAAGSVYLANTQFRFDFDAPAVHLPNGVGRVRVMGGSLPRDAKLMGGRLGREGENWFLSCQWQMPKPPPLPEAKREAGVRIGATIQVTTCDDRGQTKEYKPVEINKRFTRRYKLDSRKLSRRLLAHNAKKKRLQKRGKNGRRLRLTRSANVFEASARLAKRAAHIRDQRNDNTHKITCDVVRRFQAIQVQKVDVARMMKKSRRDRKTTKRQNEGVPLRRRAYKRVRVMMQHAATSTTRLQLAYKMADAGRDYGETDNLEAIAQTCHRCGTINPQMKDGRQQSHCTGCGVPFLRNRNAAGNEQRLLQERKKKKEKV